MAVGSVDASPLPAAGLGPPRQIAKLKRPSRPAAEDPACPCAAQPFDFDISVTADKKRRARGRGHLRARSRPRSAVCDRPGCGQPGKFRAPKSPDHLDEFLWFCLDHVREYNLKWNFFESYSDADLERQFAADRVWGRPTRPFREAPDRAPQPHAEGRAWQRFGFDDPMQLPRRQGDAEPGRPSAAGARRGCRRPSGGRSRSSTRRTPSPRPRSAGSTRRWSRTCTPT